MSFPTDEEAAPGRPLLRLQFWLCGLALSAAMLLGGGQGGLGDRAAQLLALAVLALVVLRHANEPDARLPALAWLALLPLLLPLLQLLPVPAALWQWPSARVELAADLAQAGVEPMQRLGLLPLAAERALHWLLPAVALFLAALQLPSLQRRRLAAWLVGLVALGSLLGMAQMAGEPGGPLRFYTITNKSSAVGFFANRNHHAGLLAMALPFVLLGTAWWLQRQRDHAARWLWAMAGLLLMAVLVLGITLAASRAGLALGMLGIALAAPGIVALYRAGGSRWKTVMAGVVGLVLVAQLGLSGLMKYVGKDPLDDERFRYTPVLVEAARAHAPLGTGLGGFRTTFESFDHSAHGNEYVNHAHNDYAELWLEGGWPALLLGLPLLVAFVLAGWHAFVGMRRGRGPDPQGDRIRWLAQAAWIALLLVLLHSLVDYPLRTSAHLAVFGLLAGLLSRPPSPSES